jgi:trimethylamine-N-oxide reductase (cytochrome c)
MAFANIQFSVTLLVLEKMLRIAAMRHPRFAERLKERSFAAQIKLRDNSQGRCFYFKAGKVSSKTGGHEAKVVMVFQSAEVAARILRPDRKQLDFLHAVKNFQIEVQGPDDLTIWFSETLNMLFTAGAEYGTDMGNGVMRFASNTNGGPVFVYVKDDKIIRITPIEFDDEDAPPWTIKARGKSFTPPRKTTISSHTLAWKSLVYSPDRLLYPMKRVDFDPKGERNPQNRGISGYERIAWDEALDLVAGEIQRVKREHGPGAIMNGSGSHHTWGALGYWLSARIRFFNTIGCTMVAHNPDSWEGWYWGAMHHWGYSAHNGGGETYGGSRRGRAPTARWCWRSPTCGLRRTSTTRTTSPSELRGSRSGPTTSSAKKTESPRRRNGRRLRLAFRLRMSGRWRGNGEPRKLTWPPAGLTVSEPHAERRRGRIGHAGWSA